MIQAGHDLIISISDARSYLARERIVGSVLASFFVEESSLKESSAKTLQRKLLGLFENSKSIFGSQLKSVSVRVAKSRIRAYCAEGFLMHLSDSVSQTTATFATSYEPLSTSRRVAMDRSAKLFER